MDIRQAIIDYVLSQAKEYGYDGLCYGKSMTTCFCGLDDLLNCGSTGQDCVGGFQGPSPDEFEDFHLYPNVESAEEQAREYNARVEEIKDEQA